MKKLLPILIALLAPFMLRAQQADPSTLTKVGDKCSAFTFTTADNKTLSTADLKGKIIIINFFATWCGPCRQEFPRVQSEIWDKYKNNPHFALFAFAREQGMDKIAPFREQYKYTFPLLPDLNRKIYSLFATQYIPRTVVIDENGIIIYQSMGYMPGEFDKLVTLLSNHLDKTI